jgi:hypothetical protein
MQAVKNIFTLAALANTTRLSEEAKKIPNDNCGMAN